MEWKYFHTGGDFTNSMTNPKMVPVIQKYSKSSFIMMAGY
jgi:hypothetical protein